MSNNNNNNVEKVEDKVYVVRELAEVKGEIYANYNVIMKIENWDDKSKQKIIVEKKIRMDVPRNDTNMYDVLKMVYMGDMKRELHKTNITNTGLDGRKRTSTRYDVICPNTGIKAQLVPSGESNKALLEYHYSVINAKVNEVEEAIIATTTA